MTQNFRISDDRDIPDIEANIFPAALHADGITPS